MRSPLVPFLLGLLLLAALPARAQNAPGAGQKTVPIVLELTGLK